MIKKKKFRVTYYVFSFSADLFYYGMEYIGREQSVLSS